MCALGLEREESKELCKLAKYRMHKSVNSAAVSVGWNWQEARAESNGVDSLTPLLSKQLILL